MAGITTVLFDLDETLCDQRRHGRAVLSEAFSWCGLDPFFTWDEYVAAVHTVGGTESDVRRREQCFERLAEADGRDRAVGRRLAYVYEGLRDYSDVAYINGAEDALDSLADEYRLGLVTNGGPDTQSPKIDALGLRTLMETVVLAGWETPAKPDPEPLDVAMADLGVGPDETVYVGNSARSDVAAAEAAGVTSVLVPDGARPEESAADHVLDSITALRSAPWRA
ncbi:HAD family hydrolase [Halomicroarcula sp. S1AR25-4]|uniref:HAD family hydrolase n=1 Tax=Haloarcula sp. S1AR25-4 TaxID=2950538 RepID=UPI00287545A4|nr:HAD-IA family hydrolase [Halomicroarcula sp. S1AR25-4]MDS0277440.1 HAD family hydrolase [Halomicroarcula sp. S1AR25-4]